MTFTNDNMEKGKTLHADLKQVERVRRAPGCSFDERQAYLSKKDEVRSFWLRHGEDALATLEEAWEVISGLIDRGRIGLPCAVEAVGKAERFLEEAGLRAAEEE